MIDSEVSYKQGSYVLLLYLMESNSGGFKIEHNHHKFSLYNLLLIKLFILISSVHPGNKPAQTILWRDGLEKQPTTKIVLCFFIYRQFFLLFCQIIHTIIKTVQFAQFVIFLIILCPKTIYALWLLHFHLIY